MSSDQTSGKDTTTAMPKEKENHQDRKLKPPPPDHHVKCPRCDSPNTKFCYYNNYSLSQPRHFCKTCRRYWTKGGALRNVPIGGGCRKNKRMKQRLAEITNSRDSSSCEIMGSTNVGLNFFQGFLTPAMDFQLGVSSINPQSSSSMFNPSDVVDTNFSLYDPHRNAAQVNSSSYNPSSGAAANFMGFDYLRSGGGGDPHHVLDGITQQIGTSTTSNNNSMIVHSNLASSIESLSSINQELHWKLQQQRLAVLLSESHRPENQTTTQRADMAQVEDQFDYHQTRTQNFLLQQPKEADPYSTGGARTEGGEIHGKSRLAGDNIIGVNSSSTEWFFDVSPYANARRPGLDDHEGDKISDQTADGNDNQNNNWNTGIQAWRDLQQYNGALP